MQTKSNIQLIRENLELREAFKDNIKTLINDYTIKNCYFSPSYGMSPKMIRETHSINEHTNGYFVIEHEYTNIDEAISNMTLQHTIRIIDNDHFQLGKRFEKLSEARKNFKKSLEGENENIIDILTSAQIV